jgi:hypothetical protein
MTVTPYLFVTTAVAGFAAFAALHHLHVWWLSRRERVSLLFAAYCATSAFFTVTLIGASTATSVATGQLALDA